MSDPAGKRYDVRPEAKTAGTPQVAGLFRRFELKFYLSESMIPRIRELSAPYVQRDPFAAQTPNGQYTVRSIYYDSPDMHFYHEKLDGVKTRKKLRIRSYSQVDGTCSDRVWFEIKRKVNRLSLKERASIPLEQLDIVLQESIPAAILDDLDFRARTVLDKYKYNMRSRGLKPIVLVIYEREPFVGRDRPSNRLTLDRKMRSGFNPTSSDLFTNDGLRQIETDRFVLEMKFDDRMPAWMARIIQELNLRSQAYSKFCVGIDAWMASAD
jgi:hypothetical protein